MKIDFKMDDNFDTYERLKQWKDEVDNQKVEVNFSEVEILKIIDSLYFDVTIRADDFIGNTPSPDYYKNVGWNNALDRVKKEIYMKLINEKGKI